MVLKARFWSNLTKKTFDVFAHIFHFSVKLIDLHGLALANAYVTIQFSHTVTRTKFSIFEFF